VLDDELLADWCLGYLDVPLKRVLFRSGHVSEVVGVELLAVYTSWSRLVPSSLESWAVCAFRPNWPARVSHVRDR
jgi:hypothetical protein